MLFQDQIGNTIEINHPPQRIISLVPSQTELLYHLGLGDSVVGITKFCIHPEEWFRSKERVGGPKQLDIEKIRRLNPDLIIANKEENIQEQIEVISEFCPVWISDIYTLEDSLQMIQKIGAICGVSQKSDEINLKIKQNFLKLKPIKYSLSVLYLIWKDPFMAVASNTFIHHIIEEHLGLQNCMREEERYPVLDESNLPQPDIVFLSTEPYPFKEKHIAEVQAFFPKAKIRIVDGEYFTWYGSRLIDTPNYLETVKKMLALV
ncbi:MAG: ABC transporter substrate-binding protein [Brumimicrobium sp.]|nr:ABC transporter substrate-binding protein [Brumimicrobium sp.]